ncbi:MAG TPA: alpha/beta fold hydrolase [Bdellovibrionales bacterium]|nr:alpha/beta fold hydrolase [Bdellovibrionales bacterium]
MSWFESTLIFAIEFVRAYWIWLLVAWLTAGAAGFAITFLYVRYRLTTTGIAPAHEITSVEKLIPESKHLELDCARIHYVQSGTGPDVVLLHGIGASIYVWRFLFPILQMRHRVTAFDLPGFGQSCKEADRDYGLDAQTNAIIAALDSMGIQKAQLVGSSMGGAIALWMAKLHPERFEHVAVLGPATNSLVIPSRLKHLAPTAPWFRFGLQREVMKLLLGFVVSRREYVTDEVVEKYLEPFKDRGEGVRAFVAATSLLADPRLPGQLKTLTSKTLVIWGAKDNLVKRWSIRKLMRILPNATLIEHPTAGHHIMEDEPVWTAKHLELFFSDSSSNS